MQATVSLSQALTLAFFIASPALFIVVAGVVADIATRIENRIFRK
jgi:hypothetical protein